MVRGLFGRVGGGFGCRVGPLVAGGFPRWFGAAGRWFHGVPGNFGVVVSWCGDNRPAGGVAAFPVFQPPTQRLLECAAATVADVPPPFSEVPRQHGGVY